MCVKWKYGCCVGSDHSHTRAAACEYCGDMDELDALLDERVGSDPELLRELLEDLTSERDEIKQQASRSHCLPHSQFTRTTRSPREGALSLSLL